jgi:hypothetical protein
MSLLSPFARKSKASEALVKPPCRHLDLAPRWDSAAAMGKQELITHYQCCACGVTVSKEDAAVSS